MAVPSPVPAEPVLTGPANALVARQPIYNGVLEVFAYELLFRVDSVTGPDGIDPDEATARTMLATLVEVGLDALVGDRVGYLNSTGRFILDGFAELAPPARVGFEVLESVEPSDELVMALHRLRGLSYPILLDDFVYSEERRPLLEACDIVKIDVLALSRDEIREQLAFVKPFRRVLLAEKVEDYETYEFCRDIGFDLFQGYFFCKPRTMSVQEIPIYRLSKLQLMAALMDDDLTVGQLEQLIEHDVGLSYRLLRLVNSSFLHRRGGVRSIRHAAIMLGRSTIRTWASVLALAAVDDRPNELMVVALVRARMSRLLAQAMRTGDEDAAFTVGLLSVIDAFLDMPKEKVFESLAVSEDVRRAVVEQRGPLGDLLTAVIAYEQGSFHEVELALPPDKSLRDFYVDALDWTADFRTELELSTR